MNLVIQVVGPRKSGKTTLVKHLLIELKKLNIEPIIVKQTKHRLEETDSGDTKRFLEADAKEIWLLTPNGIRLQSKSRPNTCTIISCLEGVVIFEGGKGLNVREWYSIVTWKNEIQKAIYWKPNTIADMGPQDRAPIVAWKVARIIATLARARLSRSLFHPSTLGKLIIARSLHPSCRGVKR